jgi:hypothetical protein
MVNLYRELYGLATHLAVLDVNRGAGAKIDQCLKRFAAIRALDHMKLAATGGAAGATGILRLEHGLQAVPGIDLTILSRH